MSSNHSRLTSQLDHPRSPSKSQNTVIALRGERHKGGGDDTLRTLHGEKHNSSGVCCVVFLCSTGTSNMKHEPRGFQQFGGIIYLREDLK